MAAEEYGFVLVAAIIAIFAGVVVSSLVRLMRERDTFARLAGTGLVYMFAIQAISILALRYACCQLKA